MLERAAHDDQQLVDLERLLQVVERAELHRLDRALDRRVRRHHQDLRALALGRRRRRYSRIRSRPLSSGITLSTMKTSNARSAEQTLRLARARGLDDVVAGVAQRAARAPSGSFLRRRRGGWIRVGCHHAVPVGARGDRSRQVDADLGAAARCARHRRSCRRGPRRCSWRSARPRPVPPRLVVKYGSKTRGRSAGVDADAAIGDRRSSTRSHRASSDAWRSIEAGSAGRTAGRARAAGCRRCAPVRPRAPSFTRMAGVHKHVDERDAQPFGVGRDRRRATSRDRAARRRRAGACAAAADSRQSAFRSAGASSNRIGRAKSRTSLTMRFRRATSSSMSATASRSAAGADVGLAQRVERRLDDHQRVPDFVRDDGRQPAERRQPLLLRHLALEARDRDRSAC